MSDRRLTPANGRVAAAHLQGRVRAERFVEGAWRSVRSARAALWREADGLHRDRELLFGDSFLVLEDRDGRAFGQAGRDGYVGYLDSAALGAAVTPTHAVSARSTHLYPAPDLKAPPRLALSFGSLLRVSGQSGRFLETGGGFVPEQHLRPLSAPLSDPAGVAELFLGVPYGWGGNSIWGIDCYGLVQAALLACGQDCPGDSDLQETALGGEVARDAPVRRGDLFFWKGHVAMAQDGDRLIHANAHHMAVAIEPIGVAIARIAAQGDGPVTSRRRL